MGRPEAQRRLSQGAARRVQAQAGSAQLDGTGWSDRWVCPLALGARGVKRLPMWLRVGGTEGGRPPRDGGGGHGPCPGFPGGPLGSCPSRCT